MIIRLIIQTILLYPSGAVWTDGPSNVSRLDPSGAVQIDAEHPARNRKVEGRSCTRLAALGVLSASRLGAPVTPGLLGLVRGLVGARQDLVGGSSPCRMATPAGNISAGGVVIGSGAGVGDRAGPYRRE